MARPEGRQREVQRTLRVGVGGATGRVSRERSNRGGVGLAQEAAGMRYFELNARRWQARVGWGVPPPMFVVYMFLYIARVQESRSQENARQPPLCGGAPPHQMHVQRKISLSLHLTMEPGTTALRRAYEVLPRRRRPCVQPHIEGPVAQIALSLIAERYLFAERR